jgi:hypothetical protein
MSLAALVAGIYRPGVLLDLFFWLALLAAAIGSLGIGMTVASIARTQRSASMGALGYLFVIALVLFICQHGNIPWLPYITLEYHCPRMLHAALTGSVTSDHWVSLAASAGIAVVWVSLATVLFRRMGWQ